MASKIQYICQSCGYVTPRWMGKCPNCEEWNSLVEESIIKVNKSEKNKVANKAILLQEISTKETPRYSSGILELDRVLGGGIVLGSFILLGGDPGIGKSTLLLQMVGHLANQDKKVLYVSGEESAYQIMMRAERLGIDGVKIYILAENDIEAIKNNIHQIKPDLVVLDSIQAVHKKEISSAPGGVGQVRECAAEMMSLAKEDGISIFLVGHVTKGGLLAGPRVLEHMVDTVIYFEGDSHYTYRLLRSVKNRFGSTSEIGVFQMMQEGLVEVSNPSTFFLMEHGSKDIPGSVVVPTLEGSRTLLVEIQALVSSTSFGTPRRMATGLDYNRVVLILAVLEKRIGFNLGAFDVYINAVGGVRLYEPAVDLGIALAIVSSLRDIALKDNLVVLGEIGLTGEIRPISQLEKRLTEISRLGFTQCIIPKQKLKKDLDKINLMQIYQVATLKEAVEIFL